MKSPLLNTPNQRQSGWFQYLKDLSVKFTVHLGFYNCTLLNLNSFPGLFFTHILNHHNSWAFILGISLPFTRKTLLLFSPYYSGRLEKFFIRINSRMQENGKGWQSFHIYGVLETREILCSLWHSYWTQPPVSRIFTKNSLSLFDSFLLTAKL